MRDMERRDYSISRVVPLTLGRYVRHCNIKNLVIGIVFRVLRSCWPKPFGGGTWRIAAHAVLVRARFNSGPELLNGLRYYGH
jgi:hypothetical protein